MPERARLAFLDVLRGVALIVMVLNHTSRWWIDRPMGWWRYWLVYGTVTVAAPIFLFLVGFVLPVSLHKAAMDPAAPSRLAGYLRRGLQIIAAGLLLNLVVFPEESVWSGGVLQTIGLSIIVMTLLAPVLRHRGGGTALLALAVAAYVLFIALHPRLSAWLLAHPMVGLVLFFEDGTNEVLASANVAHERIEQPLFEVVSRYIRSAEILNALASRWRCVEIKQDERPAIDLCHPQ